MALLDQYMSMFGITGSPDAMNDDKDVSELIQRLAEAQIGGGDSGTLPFTGIAVTPDAAQKPKTMAPSVEPNQLETPRTPLTPPQLPKTPDRLEVDPGARAGGTTSIAKTPGTMKTAPLTRATPGPGQSAPGAARAPAPPIQTPDFSPSFGERLSTFGNALSGRPYANHAEEQRKAAATFQVLTQMGLEPKMAEAATRNPELLKMILATQVAAPPLQEFSDEYGRKTMAAWDPKTRRYVPVEIPGQQRSQAAAPSEGAAPAASPAMPQQQGGPGFVAPAPSSALPLGTRVGGPVPKVPEGYVQRPAPDGSGFLYQNGQPLLDLKAEVESRARATEATNAKRGEAEVESEGQRGGVSAIISTARGVTKQPGFDDALKLGRAAEPVRFGLPYIGEFSPADMGYGLARATNPESPVWGVMDDIKATQERLKGIIARPLFKGQGSVSDSERRMIAEMIGKLPSASSRADYQFKLNSIEQMLTDMYTRATAKGAKPSDEQAATRLEAINKGARPEVDEMRAVVTAADDRARGEALTALAAKYRVDPEDMWQHILDSRKYLKSDGRAAPRPQVKPRGGLKPGQGGIPADAELGPDGNYYKMGPNGKYIQYP